MWWAILLVFLGGAACAGVLLAHGLAARRRRSAGWDNLHERGKLFTLQLAQLRELEAGKTAKPVENALPKRLKDASLLLPQRPTLQGKTGSSNPALDAVGPG